MLESQHCSIIYLDKKFLLFQEKFKVYDRANKSCLKPECEGSIKKIYISNRSTFYCQKCQKIKY